MSNEKEQKPTVLEANMAFDASPALFESIMNEGPIKYGPEDSAVDMITTPEGDEVVDPRSIMDVNVEAPIQSGATFNSTVDPISEEEGDQYMSQFQDYIENIHKQEITDDDIDVAGATIQMLNNTRQDVSGYIRQQIADATKRLSQQNANPAQPDGVVSDMTGDDRIPSEGTEGVSAGEDAGVEGAPDLGDAGLVELDTTTHLTPEEEPAPEAGLGEDLGAMASDPDFGLGGFDAGTEAPAEPELGAETPAEPAVEEPAAAEKPAAAEEPSGDENYDPFSDLDLGGEEGAAEEAGAGEEAGSDDGAGAGSEEESTPAEETPAPVDEEPASEEEEGEEKKDKPLTESAVRLNNFHARLEAVVNDYNNLCKKREAQAKCEAIVNAANKKMLAESVEQKNLKAQCESIVGAYRKATASANLKAKLEGIVGKYNEQKMLAESVAQQAAFAAPQAQPVLESENRFAQMKAQCESIVNNFRNAESTANAARAIIDSYKQKLA